MKRLLVILLSLSLFLCATNALAQAYGPSDGSSSILASGSSTVKYRGFLEYGMGYDVFEGEMSFEASTSHGVQIGDCFYVGAYFNFYNTDSDTSLSGGVDTRYFFCPSSQVRPYVGLQAGGGVWSRWKDPIFAIMPMGGVSFSLRKINLSMGLKSAYMFETMGLLLHFGIGF